MTQPDSSAANETTVKLGLDDKFLESVKGTPLKAIAERYELRLTATRRQFTSGLREATWGASEGETDWFQPRNG